MEKKEVSKRIKLRKFYSTHHGDIPDGYEIHHVVPIHSGGGNNIENLVALSADEHRAAHLSLYEKSGDFRDLCAYHMIGNNFSEAHRISASAGGKASHAAKVESGVLNGFAAMDKETHIDIASKAGKTGGARCVELGVGIHAQSYEDRLELLTVARQVQLEIGANRFISATLEEQSSRGKRGGVKNKGFRWYNDGLASFKYTPKMQERCSFVDFLRDNPKFVAGRIKTNK